MEFSILENIYITLILIFMLSILDFWMTFVAKKYYAKYFNNYINVDAYELNPMWQKNINIGKYNFRYLLVMILLLVFTFILYQEDSSTLIYEFFVGFQVILLLIVNTQHLQNIFASLYIKKYPYVIVGKLQHKIEFTYYVSFLHHFSILLILLFIILFDLSIFLTGGIIGILFYNIKKYSFYRKIKQESSYNK